jgi:hypothetical protein
MDKNNRFEFIVNVFDLYGNSSEGTFKKQMILDREVSIQTINRARLHRWLDTLIDSDSVTNINIHKYNIETGYTQEHQQTLLKRENILDKLEKV